MLLCVKNKANEVFKVKHQLDKPIDSDTRSLLRSIDVFLYFVFLEGE